MAKTYKTAEACRALDVQPYVLRYWETEFSALGGKKSGPQRVYSEGELKVLKRIKELLYDEGYTMGGAKKKLTAELEGETDSSSGTDDTAEKGASPAKAAPAAKQATGRAAQKKTTKEASGKAGNAKPAKTRASNRPKQAKPDLDTADQVQIETTLLAVRKLHAEAAEILSLVRDAK